MTARRFAIAGAGLVGRKRGAALRAMGHRVVAVSDPDAGRAQALAEALGAACAPGLDALLGARPEAVIVATTHDALVPVATAALEAGAHGLVEKPAARSAAELAPLLACAARTGRVLRTGFNHRFHPAIARAHRLVSSGECGPVLHIRGRYGHGGRRGMETEWRCDPARAGGGELIDQAPHLIDLARLFLGDLRLDHAALPRLFWDSPVEDNVFLALSSGPRQAWLHASWTEWKNRFGFEIACRDALLVIEGLGGSYGPERLTIHRMRPEMGPPGTTVEAFDGEDLSWQAEIADFLAAIDGAPTRGATGEDALAVLRLTDAARGMAAP